MPYDCLFLVLIFLSTLLSALRILYLKCYFYLFIFNLGHTQVLFLQMWRSLQFLLRSGTSITGTLTFCFSHLFSLLLTPSRNLLWHDFSSLLLYYLLYPSCHSFLRTLFQLFHFAWQLNFSSNFFLLYILSRLTYDSGFGFLCFFFF